MGVKSSNLRNGKYAKCLRYVVDPDGQESEHLHSYLEISGHGGVTWWLAHTVASVLYPKHVHHPWSQVTISGNTRISSVSDVYNAMYLRRISCIQCSRSKYVYLTRICHVSLCISMYLKEVTRYSKIHANTPQALPLPEAHEDTQEIHCKYAYLPKYTQIRIDTRIERKPPKI